MDEPSGVLIINGRVTEEQWEAYGAELDKVLGDEDRLPSMTEAIEALQAAGISVDRTKYFKVGGDDEEGRKGLDQG
jgi:hypothetical protein